MKQPKIRFKEFSEEWEENIFGDMGSSYSGLSGKTKDDFGDGDKRYITFLNVLTNAKIDSSILDSVRITKGEKQNLVKKGDLLFNTSSETPEEVGMCSVMAEDLNDVYLNSFCFGFRLHNNSIDSNFIAYLMRSNVGRRIMSILAQGATRYNLSKSIFLKTAIKTPKTKNEQEAIASFFSTLDSQIKASGERVASSKRVKAASLQAMFPQEGENTPRLRFKGFEGEWEYDKIGNICKITTGKSNTQDQVQDGKYPFFIRSEKIAKSAKYLYNTEAVITIGDGNIGKVFHYIDGKFDLHQRCYMMYEFQSIINAKYFYYFFVTHFYDRAIKMSAKATVDSVRLDMIAKMDIKYPSFNEQRAIASYFSNLDRQIDLQEQRLEKLKQIKAACLYKMFV